MCEGTAPLLLLVARADVLKPRRWPPAAVEKDMRGSTPGFLRSKSW